MRAPRVLLPVLLALSVAGCRTLWVLSRPAVPRCEAQLVSTQAMGASFRARYAVRVRHRDVDEHFTLFVELGEGELVLVGLNPFGAEVFTLVQSGTVAAQRGDVLPGFPVPPENVLGDFHRMRFLREAELREHGVAEVRSCGTTTRFALVEERLPGPGE